MVRIAFKQYVNLYLDDSARKRGRSGRHGFKTDSVCSIYFGCSARESRGLFLAISCARSDAVTVVVTLSGGALECRALGRVWGWRGANDARGTRRERGTVWRPLDAGTRS